MSKPGVFELTRIANIFLIENKDVFLRRLALFLPVGLALTALTQFSAVHKIASAQIILLVGMMVLQGFFALSWTRFSLQGRGAEAVSLRAVSDWRYVFLFIGLALFPALPAVGANLFILLEVEANGVFKPSAMFSIALIAASVVALWGTLCHLLLLPARAVRTDMSWAGARAASRGIRLKIFGAFLTYLLVFILLFYLYSAAIGIVAMISGEGARFDKNMIVALSTVLSIPVFIGILTLIALTSTIIVRSYEWGLGNNKI